MAPRPSAREDYTPVPGSQLKIIGFDKGLWYLSRSGNTSQSITRNLGLLFDKQWMLYPIEGC